MQFSSFAENKNSILSYLCAKQFWDQAYFPVSELNIEIIDKLINKLLQEITLPERQDSKLIKIP